MTSGIILDADDIKKLIAEKFDVDEKDIIKSQYSWIVRKEENYSRTHLISNRPPK